MYSLLRRIAASRYLSATLSSADFNKQKCCFLALTILSLLTSVPPAHAIVVRGTVTDPLGAAIMGARVSTRRGSEGCRLCHHRLRMAAI